MSQRLTFKIINKTQKEAHEKDNPFSLFGKSCLLYYEQRCKNYKWIIGRDGSETKNKTISILKVKRKTVEHGSLNLSILQYVEKYIVMFVSKTTAGKHNVNNSNVYDALLQFLYISKTRPSESKAKVVTFTAIQHRRF